MAPKKKPPTSNDAVPATTRVTRSSTRRPASDPPAPKKPKPTPNVAPEKQEPEEPVQDVLSKTKPKTITIEHCKQCNAFKTRAIQVKNGLEKGVEGVKVVVNPEKPRRGCFEIREDGGEVFVSLKDMKRPFKPMKDLDMDRVVEEIVEKIRN